RRDDGRPGADPGGVDRRRRLAPSGLPGPGPVLRCREPVPRAPPRRCRSRAGRLRPAGDLRPGRWQPRRPARHVCRPVVGPVAAAALVAAVPVVVVRAIRTRRLKTFEAQLPDTLNLLAGSLRAGYSFLQCVEAVAQETTDPMARELRRALAEARLGRPVEEALG